MGFSQKETWKWYFGNKAALDFSLGNPVGIGGSAMIGTLIWEPLATISDVNGNLLFYSNGDTIWNKNNVPMLNGTGLSGNSTMTQGAIFIPKPGSTTIYYLFTIGGTWTTGWELFYDEIDLTLNAGLGDVTLKNQLLYSNSSEKMTAVRACNGTDVWLITHHYSGTTFNTFHITSTGINAVPVVSNTGTNYTATGDALGQMKASPNGANIGATLFESQISELYDFNKSTGVVSNGTVLGPVGQFAYGAEFSPDNTKFYASYLGTPSGVCQWDLCAGSPASVTASRTDVSTNAVYHLQMGSNGKIYCCTFGQQTLDVINTPNVAGLGCNYVSAAQSIAPYLTCIGLPNFITSYFDTPSGSPLATASQVNSGSCGCTGTATASILSSCVGAPYTYVWSTGQTIGPVSTTTTSITNLCPGTYTLVVNDASCKKDTLTYTITGSGNSFSVTPTSVAATCGISNGTAAVNITGGTIPYTYIWTPTSQTTSAATGLAAGIYSVTITDNSGCTQIAVVNVSSASGGSVTVTSQNISCNGGTSGTAFASTNGGTAPFTYLWSNGGTTAQISNLTSQTYSVVVTDASGCSSTQTVSITQPTAISTTITNTSASCNNSDGTATVTASGGSGSYTYLWNPTSASASSVSGLTAGIYSVTITDANGCTQIVSTIILNSNGPTATANGSTTIQAGNSATLTATGGGTYAWTPSYALNDSTLANPTA